MTAYSGGSGGLRIRGLPVIAHDYMSVTVLPARINGPVNWLGGSAAGYATARLIGGSDSLNIDRVINNGSLVEVQLSAAPSGTWQIGVTGAYMTPA